MEEPCYVCGEPYPDRDFEPGWGDLQGHKDCWKKTNNDPDIVQHPNHVLWWANRDRVGE